jgi:ABC-2 type transport system ATP-binding protein
VSSHLLAEIERTATHVGIINKGEMLFQGTISDLHDLSKATIKIETNDAKKASEILINNNINLLHSEKNTLTVEFENKEKMGELNTILVNNGLTVYSISKANKDLENLFLDITSKY